MGAIDFTDAQQALGFVRPQFFNIERNIYEVKYPSFDYAELVPVVTEGNEWARGTLFTSIDAAGKAEFISGKGFDMPYADVSRSQFTKGFALAGVGFEWSLEELQTAAMEGINLSDTKARAARRVGEQFCWNLAMTGKPDGATSQKGWTGAVNDPSVPTTTAAATGTGSATTFPTKTPDLILADANAALTGVITSTNEVESADTLLLPTSRYLYLSSTPRSSTSDTTVLQYLQQNNVYTARTGRPLTIRGIRALETAGAGGTKRMVAYRRDPEVLRFHLPMPHRFLPPFQKSSMAWEVAGILRTGGTEVRLPSAMAYVDNI
ncbi:DUF2184 domain-containing protein [Methylorubrum extorquens]|uniref:DUF2184 domain-containing protein n=1 Tax=Methylorubrum extorquens DSM 13060 TaxID=882800 RepID=H1KC72_METEX|nr:DUF2184 domain-containing protein [Methylorubrum extorquens]EHP94889.1 Protein of unknown function DUF2184 [Methylorubrum extorquens DSM 13060]